jgi:flagellar hook-associated protein 1 FlgK
MPSRQALPRVAGQHHHQVTSAQQSVSGVNMDEETVNLLKFQQLYQANAKVIQTASTIIDTLLSIG